MTHRTPTPDDTRYLMDTIYVIGGKWRLLIMLSLSQGHTRFSDILRSIPGITPRMLSRELKHLELNKIVVRELNGDTDSTDYRVTVYCQSFDPVVQAMVEWGRQHLENIKADQFRPRAVK